MLGRYAGLVLDLDGVVVCGAGGIRGVASAIDRIRAAGARVAFVTNNATRTPDQVVALLDRAGVKADASEVVTSPMALAALVSPGARCLIIGMDGLRGALLQRGCVEVREPAEADIVAVGLDVTVCYDDLRRATRALRAGARFLATNTDGTLPSPDGLDPGAGAIIAALVAASDREPEVAGKPHAPLYQTAAARLGPGRLLMVGDRLDTDIAGAAALGWDTALVLTGVATAADVTRFTPQPTHVADSLPALVRELAAGSSSY